MLPDPGLFETIHTLRAMRRLKPDPVPDEIIQKILAAGTCAPSGQNLQRWAFLVVTDPAGKRFFGERYDYWMRDRFGDLLKHIDDPTPDGRLMKAAMHLSEHLHEAPLLLFCCGKRDWPFVVPRESRVGLAPPSYGSIYPCVQNILLACRGLGLGASLTTMHQMFEPEMHEFFGIPLTHGVVAVIPIGYPKGKFGPVRRAPAETKTHFNRWGQGKPGLAAPIV
ncbi:MAG: nitroreductase family protein [Gammaproteobacteria bacterium]|nr:nitroreductase family protein [Gammaproteobacteria bacterium]